MNDYAALRMRGLPFSCRNEDIITFFKDFDAYHESIKIGRNSDNSKTGEATILFKNEQDCKRAFQQKQGQNIAHRWIELYQITFADYLNFDET
jgi:RNA recognition motif-containing protein